MGYYVIGGNISLIISVRPRILRLRFFAPTFSPPTFFAPVAQRETQIDKETPDENAEIGWYLRRRNRRKNQPGYKRGGIETKHP